MNPDILDPQIHGVSCARCGRRLWASELSSIREMCESCLAEVNAHALDPHQPGDSGSVSVLDVLVCGSLVLASAAFGCCAVVGACAIGGWILSVF